MGAWEAAGVTDEWYTPAYIFAALGLTFDMDVAHPRDHTHTHVPARRFLYEDALDADWIGTVWMNPPFGKGDRAKLRWLNRFFDHGDGIALTPDRTSAPWFQQSWARADLCLFIGPKVKFIRPDGSLGEQPGTGTVLWAIGLIAVAALRRAAAAGLGFLAMPHVTQFVRDGDMWCAFKPGFINLHESVAGFGVTKELAEADLIARTPTTKPRSAE